MKDTENRLKELYSYKSGGSVKNELTKTLVKSETGADGNIYGIIKENNKYYIKISKPCDTIITENFDYIDKLGKSKYSYDSYNNAYKQLEFVLTNLKEQYSEKGNVLKETRIKPKDISNISESSIKEMNAELNRIKEIMVNSGNIGQKHNSNKSGWNIVKENNSYLLESTGDPESNANGADKKTQNQPFTDTPNKFQTERDNEKTNSSPDKTGSPFTDTADKFKTERDTEKTNNSPVITGELKNDVTGETSSVVKTLGNAMDSEGAVAIKKVNECNEDTSLEDVVDSNELPTQEIQDEPMDSTIDDTIDDTESQILDLIDQIKDLLNSDNDTEVEVDITPLPFEDMPNPDESIFDESEGDLDNINWEEDETEDETLSEEKLNDFGDHPRFQEQPMTTSNPNLAPLPNTSDWHDDSVHSNKPYATKVGSSTPFDNTVKSDALGALQESIVNAILQEFKHLNQKKK